MTDLARRGTVIAAIALASLCAPRPADSRPQPSQAPPGRQASPQAVVERGTPNATARETRQALIDLLRQYSPTVGRVLSLDPALVQNPTYLEPYPELAEFLRQHPEVARDSSYYFDEFQPGYVAQGRDFQAYRMVSSFFSGVTVFIVFTIVTGSLIWVIKTLVDYRRWYRLSKVQTEAHNKLLDRFTANEDLLACIATPSGKRFLESAPIMIDPSFPSVAAPVRRILWTVEAGLVVVCGGIGLMFAPVVAGSMPAELVQVVYMVGVFSVSIGVGFVLAAGASYLISRRLGILGASAPGNLLERDARQGA